MTVDTTIREIEYADELVSVVGGKVLYGIGDTTLLNSVAIGICGSRQASLSGLERAYEFGREAALKGATVVSGYARGVDRQAHMGAMAAGGRTIAVLPEGIRHFRLPKELKGLVHDRNFLAVSMFPPDAGWQTWRAMERNKLIIALSRALFVIEAGETGGTMDAAYTSHKLGKPVYVVEFKSEQSGREGNRELIRRFARPVSTIRELRLELDAVISNDERIMAGAQLSIGWESGSSEDV